MADIIEGTLQSTSEEVCGGLWRRFRFWLLGRPTRTLLVVGAQTLRLFAAGWSQVKATSELSDIVN